MFDHLSPPESSSSSSSSATMPAPRRAPSDVFRPRLPIDPFTPAHTLPAPPRVDPDAPWPARDLPALTHIFASAPHVLLVLGAPSPHALAPILRSPTFAWSLVLLVTHAPPPRAALLAAAGPAGMQPALRVLRLRAPLAPAAPAFALTLVAVLDAAAAVARAWRAAPQNSPNGGDMAQLAQDDAGAFAPALAASEHLHPAGTFAPRRSRLAPSPSASPSASPSSLSPSPPSASTPLPARPLSSASLASMSSASSLRKPKPSKIKTAPPPSTGITGGRAFDALLSFLPPAQPEKAVLKHVVLVSTLAGAFLAGPPSFSSYSANGYQTHSYSRSFSGRGGSRPGSASGIGGFDWSSAPTTPLGFGSAPSTPYAYDQSGNGSAASLNLSNIHSTSNLNGNGTSSAHPSRPPSPASVSVSVSNRSSFFGFKGKTRSTPGSVRGSPRASVLELSSASASPTANGGANGMQGQGQGQGGGPWTRAHIVHVLPATYRAGKLTGALGAFLASYSPSAPPSSSPPSSSHSTYASGGAGGSGYAGIGSGYANGGGIGSGSGGGGREKRAKSAKAYVLSERAMREVEGVLVGGVDGEAGVRGAWIAGVVVEREALEGEPAEQERDDADGEVRREREGRVEGERVVDLTKDEEEDERRRRGKERAGPYGLPTPPASDEGQAASGTATPSGSPPPLSSPAPSRRLSSANGHALPPGAALSASPSSASASARRLSNHGLPPGAAPPGPAKLRRARGSMSSSHGHGSPPASPAAFAPAHAEDSAHAEENASPYGPSPPPSAFAAFAPLRRRVDSAPGLDPSDPHSSFPSSTSHDHGDKMPSGNGANGGGYAKRGSRFFSFGRSSPDLRALAAAQGAQNGGGGGGGGGEKGTFGRRGRERKGRWWVFWA
ncbi:hypothetical protein FB451DRAFT_1415312 [Mycena latifolia]|nr:hypothetical protein FB451DRAFT_1415312 [Mycena latifolia]